MENKLGKHRFLDSFMQNCSSCSTWTVIVKRKSQIRRWLSQKYALGSVFAFVDVRKSSVWGSALGAALTRETPEMMFKSCISAGRLPTCSCSPCGRPAVSSCALDYRPTVMVNWWSRWLSQCEARGKKTAGSGSFGSVCGEFCTAGEKHTEFIWLFLYTYSIFILLLFCKPQSLKCCRKNCLVLHPIVLPAKDESLLVSKCQ